MTEARRTVALDAMGGDAAPAEQVKGALLAAERGVRVLLVGDRAALEAELARQGAPGGAAEIVSSEGVVAEGENPVRTLRANPRVSIAVAAGLVREGRADALVSMGSTGATMAASVLSLGMFEGLERPALGGPFVALAPGVSIIDLGSQVDCRPGQLVSFAALGAAFARAYQGVAEPRVGLLSVGGEQGKGNRLVQDAYPLLERSGLRFVGNVEGHEVFLNKADVVVCDGFTGNVLLKYTEGLAEAAGRHLARLLGADAEAVRAIRGLAANAESAGGPLFGVNGAVVIGHGRSTAAHYANAIVRAAEVVDRGVVDAMRSEMAAVLAKTEARE